MLACHAFANTCFDMILIIRGVLLFDNEVCHDFANSWSVMILTIRFVPYLNKT